jgi:hypothetical protein
MNGTILAYDPSGGGMLRGSDRRRYAFAAMEWKSAAPPAAGMAVDFEPDGDTARGLYAVPTAAPSPAPADVGAFLATRPGLPLAGLILLACFLPFLTFGPLSANLFNIVRVASTADRLTPYVNMETGLWLFHGLYVVPLLAVALIVQEWRGRAGPWLRIGTGIVGLVGPIAIALGARAMFTTAPASVSLTARLARGLRKYLDLDLFTPSIGMGWIAIGLLSVALIAVGIAWRFRSPSPQRP